MPRPRITHNVLGMNHTKVVHHHRDTKAHVLINSKKAVNWKLVPEKTTKTVEI